MKKFLKKIGILASILAILLPTITFAAWSATDNFDSYTVGVDLETLNGGTSWSGAWTKQAVGTQTIQLAPSGGQGGNAVRSASLTASAYDRTFANITSGTVSFRIQISNTSPDDFSGVELKEGTNFIMHVKIAGGQLQRYNGTTPAYENIQAVSANTWYTVDIQFDDAAQPDKYRVRVDGGAWTGWGGTNGAYTNINRFAIEDSSIVTSLNLWIDDIKNGGTETTTATGSNMMMGMGF